MIKDLIKKNRSYRRFDNSVTIAESTLKELVDLARMSASARNQQSLKYVLSNEDSKNAAVYDCLGWAGYLKDWDGPIPEEQPSGYIVVVNDKTISDNHFCDEGIAAQSILLGAVEHGFGGCMIAAVNRPKLRTILNLDEQYEIVLVIALGKPVEEVELVELENENFKYYRDDKGVHKVPKRSLEDILL